MSDKSSKYLKILLSSQLVAMALITTPLLMAGARPGEVHRLQEDLTPIGAERAGNADGGIPEWSGGLSTPPDGFSEGDHHKDPFAGEEPLYRIDASNLEEHRERLGAGQIAMLQRYPEFYLQVFPSHRTAAYPQRVYDMTAKNATTGALIEEGNGVSGVAEGIPFPFPESAEELIWNHQLRYKGQSNVRHVKMIAPTANASYNEVAMTVESTNPYYHEGATLESIDNQLSKFRREITTPPSLAGNVLLVHESLNQVKQPRKVWLYNPGTRRVMRAPNVAYDSPSNATDGMHVSDMLDMFNGALDRFDWQLVGKREMYVPYNAYPVNSSELDYDDLVQPGHLDPSQLRYELHRAWVIEATLKDGERHIYPRRTFYLDEDSYQILMIDHYDDKGTVWRYSEAHPISFFEVPTFWSATELHHDLKNGRYVAFRLDPEKPAPRFNMPMEDGEFTPQALRRQGRR